MQEHKMAVQKRTQRVNLIECGWKQEGNSLKTSWRAEMKGGGMAAVNDARPLYLVSY